MATIVLLWLRARTKRRRCTRVHFKVVPATYQRCTFVCCMLLLVHCTAMVRTYDEWTGVVMPRHHGATCVVHTPLRGGWIVCGVHLPVVGGPLLSTLFSGTGKRKMVRNCPNRRYVSATTTITTTTTTTTARRRIFGSSSAFTHLTGTIPAALGSLELTGSLYVVRSSVCSYSYQECW